jgi:hypothetical protein
VLGSSEIIKPSESESVVLISCPPKYSMTGILVLSIKTSAEPVFFRVPWLPASLTSLMSLLRTFLTGAHKLPAEVLNDRNLGAVATVDIAQEASDVSLVNTE